MPSRPMKNSTDLTQAETTRPAAGDLYAFTETDSKHLTELAYQIWQERGCPHGSPEDDWFEAERRLAREMQSGDQSDSAGQRGTKVDLK